MAVMELLQCLKIEMSEIEVPSWMNDWRYSVLVVLIFGYVIHWLHSKSKLPPGPWGFPFIGSLPFLSSTPHVEFSEYSKKYGDIFSVQVGSKFVVVLNSIDLTIEAFVKKGDVFSGRMTENVQLFREAAFHDQHFFAPDSQERKYTRRASIGAFCTAQSSMEPKILKEARYLSRLLEDFQGETIDVGELLNSVFCNVMTNLVFGKRYEFLSDEQGKLLTAIQTCNAGMATGTLVAFNPFGHHIYREALQGFKESAVKIMDYIGEQYDEHISHEGEPISDFADVLLKRNNMDRQTFAGATSIILCDSTGAMPLTFNWILIYLAKHKTVQAQIQKELDQTTGGTRLPCLADKKNMPFTGATLREMYRHITAFTTTFPHTVSEDTTLSGYHIPKDTIVVSNICKAHADERLFHQAREFNPSRFLNNEGTVNTSTPLLTFGAGKRKSIGENLVKNTIFLFLTVLLSSYDVDFPESVRVGSVHFIDHEPGYIPDELARLVLRKRC